MDMLHATIHQKDMVTVLNDRSTLSYMQANVDHNDQTYRTGALRKVVSSLNNLEFPDFPKVHIRFKLSKLRFYHIASEVVAAHKCQHITEATQMLIPKTKNCNSLRLLILQARVKFQTSQPLELQ